MTRRELVAAFLGAAVANASCRKERPRAQVPGALVDRAVETGHRLRPGSGTAPLPRAKEIQNVEVLIAGGGVAGLSAAWRLRGAGVKDLLLLELDEALGGTARSGKNAVSAFPWGAHYLPAPLQDRGPAAKLLHEMGAITGTRDDGTPEIAEQLLVCEPDERLFYRGAWYPGLYLRAGASADDLAQLHRFERRMVALSALRDGRGRKVFAVPLEEGSDDAEWTALDRISMAEWLEREGFTSPRLRWYVDYACRDDYGAPAERISAWAGLWYFCARRDGEKENAGFLTWPEGNGRLVRQLSSSLLPKQHRTNVLVHTLEPKDGGWLAHAWDAQKKAPLGFFARQVVFAGPRFVAGYVVAPWRTARPGFLDAFVYGPWAVANVTLNQLPLGRGYPICWDNVFYESRSLGYVVATHQREVATDVGPTVLTWYYPLDGADVRAERQRLLQADYNAWEALVMADLRAAHPGVDDLVTRIEVMRWGHAMIRPVPGFVWGGARTKAQASIGGSLHFAHSDLGGLALFEEANWHGVRAAEQVLAALGRSVSSWLG
ncbi:MAG: NAD(P)-binding protein [Myxococcaceae bacterium]|nr:NAD(P)-binding protein [Myxococcaceae bacterium]